MRRQPVLFLHGLGMGSCEDELQGGGGWLRGHDWTSFGADADAVAVDIVAVEVEVAIELARSSVRR